MLNTKPTSLKEAGKRYAAEIAAVPGKGKNATKKRREAWMAYCAVVKKVKAEAKEAKKDIKVIDT